jgi:uncharacterized OsmC-like protein
MSIAEAVAGATAYLTDHPDEARYRDSVALARLTSGLIVEVTGPGGEHLTTDMPSGIGGTATVASPGWLFRAAAAACVTSLVAIRAASTGIELGGVEVEVDSESDDRGILGLDRAIRAGAISVKVVVTIDAPGAARDQVEGLAQWALDHCPVTESIARQVPVALEIR